MHAIRSFQMATPTTLEFGRGVAESVGRAAATMGLRHVLLVTDAGLAEGPLCAAVLGSLAAAGVEATLYAGVVLDPDAPSVERAAAAYRASGAAGLVALGGGSVIDTAKALGVLATSGAEHIEPFFAGGPERIQGIPPLICLPTTAGTGSEVTYVAIVTHNGQKKLLRDWRIAPVLALVDPDLTIGMPPRLTTATGLDALSHALEALTSTLANPVCDLLALDAIARIHCWLPRAVEQGDDVAARTQMSLAATMAGQAFVNARVHLGHAVGHSLGTAYKLPHGLACIVCMPAILEFLLPVCVPQLARVAGALGLVQPNEAQAAQAAVSAITRLIAQCNAPRLSELAGVNHADLPQLVALVQAEERLNGLSPRRPSDDEWRAILNASL